ncbi:MAG: hypothetical protein P8Y27_21275, partial [Chromatiaceae bacterium]
PEAVVTRHPQLDHIGSVAGLFFRLATRPVRGAAPRLFIPVTLLPIQQRRLADYPNLPAAPVWQREAVRLFANDAVVLRWATVTRR